MPDDLKYPQLWPEGNIPRRKKHAMYRTRKREHIREIKARRIAAPKIPPKPKRGRKREDKLQRGRNPLA